MYLLACQLRATVDDSLLMTSKVFVAVSVCRLSRTSQLPSLLILPPTPIELCLMLSFQLLKIVNDLLLFWNDGNISLFALLDLSAVFDKTDPSLLLIHRLKHGFGKQGTTLEWFSSYLTSRTQSVSIYCHTSKPAPISFGVSQGTVLVPALFVLYAAFLSTVVYRRSVLIRR